MRTKIIGPQQLVLAPECSSCSWFHRGFCDGPRNGSEYLRQGDNHTSCLDTAKRELMHHDTMKRRVDRQKGPGSIYLPSFIPTVRRSSFKIPASSGNEYFGISAGKILGNGGRLLFNSANEIVKKFHLPQSAKVILIFTGNDELFERLWKHHFVEKTFEVIASMGFYCVTSPSYSVWSERFSRADQLNNLWRNLNIYDLLIGLGTHSIPFLFAAEDADFRKIGAWLQERPNILSVAIYARYYYSEKRFHQLREFMRRIEREAGRKLSFLICGMGKADNITRLKREFECVFENSSMYVRSTCGEICDERLKYTKTSFSKEDCYLINHQRHLEICGRTSERPIIYMKKPRVERFTTNKPAPVLTAS